MDISFGDNMQIKIFFQITIGVSCLISGFLCQSCTMTFNKISGCDDGKGMVSNRDSFTLSAHLDNSSGSVPDLARFLIQRQNQDGFAIECFMNLSGCVGPPNEHCNCVANSATKTITAYFSKTATVVPFDHATIILDWNTGNCSRMLETVEDPKSCAPQAVTSRAKSSECQLDFPFKYCCDSALSPVETIITVNNRTYSTGNCTTLDKSDAKDGNYTFTTKVCGTEVYKESCIISETGGSGDEDFEWWWILVALGLGGGAAGAGVGYAKMKIATSVPKVKMSATLKELEEIVTLDVQKKRCRLLGCEKVFKYKGKKYRLKTQVDQNKKLKDLFQDLVGVEDIRVTVNVFRDGTFVIKEVLALGPSVDSNSKRDNSTAETKHV